jgi:excinuclease UvrABC nuclease subunit
VTTQIEVSDDLAGLDEAIAQIPNVPAVFALWPRAGDPYLAKTALLRRRLLRLLKEREKPSRLLNLRRTVGRIEYQVTGSAFESALLMYEWVRRLFPKTYLEMLKLRMPTYVKLVLANEFPRSQLTTHIGRTQALYCGPFRSRASAERFESQFLDLFQMRRCQEDLAPSPEHPGCIYGEMSMCLRPCQQVVGHDEYLHEVRRVEEFLKSGGHSLLDVISTARDRYSEEMMFEEAARQHKRLEKVQEVLKLRDELARDIDTLHGMAITPSLEPNAVELWIVREGYWQAGRRLSFEVQEGKPVSLDGKLREILGAVEFRRSSMRERAEYLALLARWYYSSWREGEWVAWERLDQPPYRKLVHAISRVARRDMP